MLYGGIYWKHEDASFLNGYHAVLIVGWGEENGRKYWKCANSWGHSRAYITTLYTRWGGLDTVYSELLYPEKGYFRIARGVNFVGIESQLCFASALKDLPGKSTLNQTALELVHQSGAVAGGWYELPIDQEHVGVNAAVGQYKARMQQATARREGQLQLHRHTLTRVRHQIVAGSNYKLTLTAEHASTGEQYEMEGIVHSDVNGQYSVKHLGTPRRKIQVVDESVVEGTTTPIATLEDSTLHSGCEDASADHPNGKCWGTMNWIKNSGLALVGKVAWANIYKEVGLTAKSPMADFQKYLHKHEREKSGCPKPCNPVAEEAGVQGNNNPGDTSKLSTSAVGDRPTQGNDDSNDVYVPAWALWLIGFIGLVGLVVISGMGYTIYNLRHKQKNTSVAMRLEEPDLRSRATSLETIDIAGELPATLQARSPISSDIRTRGTSQEGVICLD